MNKFFYLSNVEEHNRDSVVFSVSVWGLYVCLSSWWWVGGNCCVLGPCQGRSLLSLSSPELHHCNHPSLPASALLDRSNFRGLGPSLSRQLVRLACWKPGGQKLNFIIVNLYVSIINLQNTLFATIRKYIWGSGPEFLQDPPAGKYLRWRPAGQSGLPWFWSSPGIQSPSRPVLAVSGLGWRRRRRGGRRGREGGGPAVRLWWTPGVC